VVASAEHCGYGDLFETVSAFGTDSGSEYSLHWRLVRRNDMHDDTPRAQRGCHLQANEAGTDHNYLLSRRRFRHNRLTIRERTQI
jgi:hypothetical protein